MTPLSLALIAFACIVGGAYLGTILRKRLPDQDLAGDTKDVIRLGSGLIGTIAALVLGLLIASANGTFETQRSQVRQLTANIILLDRILAAYGPEADSLRGELRQYVGVVADQIWRKSELNTPKPEAFQASAEGLSFTNNILKLSPRNEIQQMMKVKALDTFTDLAKVRLLLFANAGGALPMPFLVVLVFWLTIIFATFSLFVDRSATATAALFVFAFSAAASIFLILELTQPFTGVMQIPDKALRSVLAPLGS